ncbi:chitin-binding domain protein [Lambdina fiscellaria nucleopolyhedrovirus]|uniref:Chitin-binding domain protein n=1 Tax=Lambdina fiscellaria nucleopolyhedrovirus TaxID=1642929 RepID=A0A0E3URD9_9ABAC|nr:chitin-binding domain protein [Lambdina fiscellaria nucleopolyhedrovirus]AKC91755.1 chitin-binding domain protein [Lambdina fiscellaria nucleopolyhedrovirus]
MWLLLALFIIIKLIVFHKMKNMHNDLHMDKICPKGYHGTVPDPFDCNAYFVCPCRTRLHCPPSMQFDLDAHGCVENTRSDGCIDVLTRNLLL